MKKKIFVFLIVLAVVEGTFLVLFLLQVSPGLLLLGGFFAGFMLHRILSTEET